MKYSFVVAPKYLRVVFERCFDLRKVHFMFNSDCILDFLTQSSQFNLACRRLVFPVLLQRKLYCELGGELHHQSKEEG